MKLNILLVVGAFTQFVGSAIGNHSNSGTWTLRAFIPAFQQGAQPQEKGGKHTRSLSKEEKTKIKRLVSNLEDRDSKTVIRTIKAILEYEEPAIQFLAEGIVANEGDEDYEGMYRLYMAEALAYFPASDARDKALITALEKLDNENKNGTRQWYHTIFLSGYSISKQDRTIRGFNPVGGQHLPALKKIHRQMLANLKGEKRPTLEQVLMGADTSRHLAEVEIRSLIHQLEDEEKKKNNESR